MEFLTSGPIFSIGLMILAGIIALPGILYFVRSTREANRLHERLERGDVVHGEGRPDRRKAVGDLLVDVGKKVIPTNPEELSMVRFQLMRAGFVGQNAVVYYFLARFAALLGPQILLFIFLPVYLAVSPVSPLMGSLGLAFAGLMGPGYYISGRTKKRESEYRDGFPDMMDLLVACVEAGLSLDASVTRVSDEIVGRYPNLALHLNIIALELRAGRSRKDAWANFAKRLGLEEAGALATMLRQSEEMGTSLGKTLRVFSSTMRERRMLAAEEQALALPAKLTVPLIVFVFPTLLGVLILPAIARVPGLLDG